MGSYHNDRKVTGKHGFLTSGHRLHRLMLTSLAQVLRHHWEYTLGTQKYPESNYMKSGKNEGVSRDSGNRRGIKLGRYGYTQN